MQDQEVRNYLQTLLAKRKEKQQSSDKTRPVFPMRFTTTRGPTSSTEPEKTVALPPTNPEKKRTGPTFPMEPKKIIPENMTQPFPEGPKRRLFHIHQGDVRSFLTNPVKTIEDALREMERLYEKIVSDKFSNTQDILDLSKIIDDVKSNTVNVGSMSFDKLIICTEKLKLLIDKILVKDVEFISNRSYFSKCNLLEQEVNLRIERGESLDETLIKIEDHITKLDEYWESINNDSRFFYFTFLMRLKKMRDISLEHKELSNGEESNNLLLKTFTNLIPNKVSIGHILKTMASLASNEMSISDFISQELFPLFDKIAENEDVVKYVRIFLEVCQNETACSYIASVTNIDENILKISMMLLCNKFASKDPAPDNTVRPLSFLKGKPQDVTPDAEEIQLSLKTKVMHLTPDVPKEHTLSEKKDDVAPNTFKMNFVPEDVRLPLIEDEKEKENPMIFKMYNSPTNHKEAFELGKTLFLSHGTIETVKDTYCTSIFYQDILTGYNVASESK